MSLLRRFLFDDPVPRMVAVHDLPVDAALAERNRLAAEAAIARMGTRWALHPRNAPLSAQPKLRRDP